jgi:hypothetical protein
MHKNANLKKSMEISRFESGRKFNKDQGEFVSNTCKTNNVLIVFKEAKVGARGARDLVPHANSLAHTTSKLHPN